MNVIPADRLNEFLRTNTIRQDWANKVQTVFWHGVAGSGVPWLASLYF